MSHFHLPPVVITKEKKSIAYFLRKSPENLIVFVHGFGGSADETWEGFPTLLVNFPNSDVIFYGYDSLRTQATNSAVRFYNFLDEAVSFGLKTPIKRELKNGHQYKKIVLVAHSLGSIIVRRALLNANGEKKKWVNRCKMALFAPAHKGARILKLVFDALPSLGQIVAGAVLIKFRVLDDLKVNSLVIEDLVKDTEALLNENKGQFTIAHKVVWAGNEDIVYNSTFCKDPVATEEPRANHKSVCKPNEKYWTPLRYVTETLNA